MSNIVNWFKNMPAAEKTLLISLSIVVLVLILLLICLAIVYAVKVNNLQNLLVQKRREKKLQQQIVVTENPALDRQQIQSAQPTQSLQPIQNTQPPQIINNVTAPNYMQPPVMPQMYVQPPVYTYYGAPQFMQPPIQQVAPQYQPMQQPAQQTNMQQPIYQSLNSMPADNIASAQTPNVQAQTNYSYSEELNKTVKPQVEKDETENQQVVKNQPKDISSNNPLTAFINKLGNTLYRNSNVLQKLVKNENKLKEKEHKPFNELLRTLPIEQQAFYEEIKQYALDKEGVTVNATGKIEAVNINNNVVLIFRISQGALEVVFDTVGEKEEIVQVKVLDREIVTQITNLLDAIYTAITK